MSMNNFADTISYALKAPQIDSDLQDTLKAIHQITEKYDEEDECMKQFFKSVQPKITYLFWLFQNVENKYIEEQLSEIFEQYDDMKQKYTLSKQRKYSFVPLQEEPSSSHYEPNVSDYDTQCLL